MKGSERYLAFIIESRHVTAVEIAHSAKGKTLTAAGSFDSEINFNSPEVFSDTGSAAREKTFVKEVSAFMKRVAAGAHIFSFGLNTRMAMLQQIPIEASLTDEEFSVHLEWELKNYFPEANPTHYVTQPYALVDDNGQPGSNAMIISVKKSFVNFLNNVCGELHGSLHIIDIDQFCAEGAIVYNYPHIATKRTAVVGVDEDSMDAGLLVNGKNHDVRTIRWDGKNINAIDKYAREVGAEVIYLHGRIVTQNLVDRLKNISPLDVEMTDPFRKVALPTSIKGVDEIKARRQEYTAAVGLAVRENE